jgi:response regulator RpfG family c-di-GMP phosphodiesterase
VMNGWALLDILEVSSFKEKLVVIVVTSSIDSKDRVRSADYSLIVGFVSKPLAMEHCDEIRAALGIGPAGSGM